MKTVAKTYSRDRGFQELGEPPRKNLASLQYMKRIAGTPPLLLQSSVPLRLDLELVVRTL